MNSLKPVMLHLQVVESFYAFAFLAKQIKFSVPLVQWTLVQC